MTLSVTALAGVPAIREGDDLGAIIATAISASDVRPITNTDVLVIAHKIVSKSEGRVRRLSTIQPGAEATRLAQGLGKDPAHVQAILDESREVRRASGVLISVTHHGFVCANAGVDESNPADPDTVILLPHDPDESARRLRSELRKRTGAAPAVIITDSFGRPWRHGQTDVAIGCAGFQPMEDWRGRPDATGRELKATWIATADALAAAADLARTKDGWQPVVLVRGAGRHVTGEDGPGAKAIIRPEAEDLFK